MEGWHRRQKRQVVTRVVQTTTVTGGMSQVVLFEGIFGSCWFPCSANNASGDEDRPYHSAAGDYDPSSPCEAPRIDSDSSTPRKAWSDHFRIRRHLGILHRLLCSSNDFEHPKLSAPDGTPQYVFRLDLKLNFLRG